MDRFGNPKAMGEWQVIDPTVPGGWRELERCAVCQMLIDYRPRNEDGEQECWNWRAQICGECPYHPTVL